VHRRARERENHFDPQRAQRTLYDLHDADTKAKARFIGCCLPPCWLLPRRSPYGGDAWEIDWTQMPTPTRKPFEILKLQIEEVNAVPRNPASKAPPPSTTQHIHFSA
jgi:hypothetical protein